MGDKGSKDKGGKEDRKKPKLTIKEKRKLKHEKKESKLPGSITSV
jgi:ribosomal protein S30